jgi:hypothetical protein
MVDRRRAVSRQEFFTGYATPRQPVVLEGLINQWPALQRWTPEFWTSRFGARVVSTDEGDLALAALIDAAHVSGQTDVTAVTFPRPARNQRHETSHRRRRAGRGRGAGAARPGTARDMGASLIPSGHL